MLKLLAVCKFLAAPLAAPLALTLVIAFAAPGGVLEPSGEGGPRELTTNGERPVNGRLRRFHAAERYRRARLSS